MKQVEQGGGMGRRQPQERVKAMYTAFATGDADAYRASFTDEVVWHVPGNNPVSGNYRGPKEYFETMVQRMSPLENWTITVTDVLTNEQDNAALVAFHLSGSQKGKRVEMNGYHLVRLNAEAKIIEGWGFIKDQDALDEFFSA
jgi:ketosteroid isomerase-like protein